MKAFFVLTLLLNICICQLKAEEKRFISPDSKHISFSGALFVEKTANRVVLSRHSKACLEHPQTLMVAEKANTQTGVTLSFSTNSREITVFFEDRTDAQSRQKVFGIFKNGEFYKQATGLTFTFTNSTGGKNTEWEIVLPSFAGVNFTGIEIEKSADFGSVRCVKKPVYVAIGNSITHGVGQKGAAYLSYPFLLARQKNWELYNLAVGGSKISWPVAQLLKNTEVDIITILWGYNDWNSSLTLEQDIKPNYKKLLAELRKTQPKAKIYCILPTTSKLIKPRNGTDSLDDIRDAERGIALEFQLNGDKNIFIVEGDKLSTVDDLNDTVHLSVEGAANFAQQLTSLVK